MCKGLTLYSEPKSDALICQHIVGEGQKNFYLFSVSKMHYFMLDLPELSEFH